MFDAISTITGVRPVASRVLVGLLLTAGSIAAATAQESRPSEPAQRARVPLDMIAGVGAPPASQTAPAPPDPGILAGCERARGQLEDGRLHEAYTTLTGLRDEQGGGYYEVHYLFSLLHAAMGQMDAARESAEQAARTGYGHVDVHYHLGKIMLQAGETDSAIAQFRTATLAGQRELNNVKVTLAWYMLGHTLAEAGYDLAAAQAYAHFDRAAWETHTEHRNAPEMAALLAEQPHGMVPERLRLLNGLKRFDDALVVAKWARGIWPDDVVVIGWQARVLLARGDAVQAYDLCRRHMSTPADREMMLPTAVEAAAAADRLSGWVESVTHDLAGGTGLRQAEQLLRCLAGNGEYEHAICLGQTLLQQMPDSIDVAWTTAAAKHAVGDSRGMLETLIEFVRSSPQLAELPAERLASWMEWVRSDDSISALVKDMKSKPGADYATDFVLGVSALATGEERVADELLASCLELRPEFSLARLAPAKVLLSAYQWDAAAQLARKLLDQHPDLAAAYFILGEAHDGLDDNDKAVKSYKRAIKLRPDEPVYKLALARHFMRMDNLRSAQRYFQATLEDDPHNGEALEGLIDCYVRGDKVEIARSILERADAKSVPTDAWRRIQTTMRHLSSPFGPEHLADLRAQFEQHPDDLATARLLAGGLFFNGRVDDACSVIKTARGVERGDYHLTILLANAYAIRGEFQRAIELRELLRKRYPNRRGVLDTLALCYLYEFRVDEARLIWTRLIDLADDDETRGRYRDSLIESYLKFGDFDRAVTTVNATLEAAPDSQKLFFKKLDILIAAERNDEAFALLAKWFEGRSTIPAARSLFCDYGRRCRHHDEVIAKLRSWLDDEPDNAELTGILIETLIDVDAADEALKVAREFTGTYEQSVQRRIWLGLCESAGGDVDTALAEFDAILSERLVKPSDRQTVRQDIIFTLVTAKRYDEALKRCRQWSRDLDGTDTNARIEILLYKRGILQAAGRNREYSRVMELLLQYAPNDVVLLNDLGYTWVDQGLHVERATRMIRKAVAQDPLNAAYLDSLGWAYYKAGRFGEARKYLGRAVRLIDGRDAVVFDHLADAAFREGDEQAARDYWNRALTLIEAEDVERVRETLLKTAEAVRAKLDALGSSKTPAVAPIADKQTEQTGNGH